MMYEFHPITEEPADIDPQTGCMMQVITALTIVVAILAGILFGGCSRTNTQTVERVRTDTLIITNQQRDSIFIHDSVSTYQQQAGDTLYIYRDRWRTEYRDRAVYDTIYRARVDSIPVPYPVIKEVNRLTWWQKSLAWVGAIAIFFIIIIFLKRFIHL